MKSLFFLSVPFILLTGLAKAVPVDKPGSTGLTSANFTIFGDSLHQARTLGDDPSKSYNYWASIELWIGLAKTQLGQLVGKELNAKVVEQLNQACPDNSGGSCDRNEKFGFNTDCWVGKGAVAPCFTKMDRFVGSWQDEETRNLLVHAAADALEALTNNPANCAYFHGKKTCLVGDVIRINMPTIQNFKGSGSPKKNFLHFYITNDASQWLGEWACCQSGSRYYVDLAIDKYGSKIGQLFPKNGYTRDVRCIIDGYKACSWSNSP